jgi:hypothetical protein
MTPTVVGATSDDIGVPLSDAGRAQAFTEGVPTMLIGLKYAAPLLATGTIVAAFAVAPIAVAATSQDPSSVSVAANSSGSGQSQQSCVTLGGTQSECQSPGNAQVYDAPPQVDYFPYAGGGT